MRILRKTLVKVTVLLILAGCHKQSDVIEINKNRFGGLYETDENGKEYTFNKGEETFKLDTLTFISFREFDQIVREESENDRDYSLGFKLNDAGKLKFKEMTERNIGKPICFVVGDKVMAAPTVMETIPSGKGAVTVADKTSLDEMIEYLKN